MEFVSSYATLSYPIRYCDADWIGCLDSQCSKNDFHTVGGSIAWSSYYQKCVSTSTIEVERDHQGDGVNSPNSTRLSTSQRRTYYY
jgi:hypothetical protein